MPTIAINPVHAPALEVFYEDAGEGPPAVLVGGLSSTHEVYARQVEALSRRYRVLAPDNRGSGRTRIADDDGDRAIDRMAEDLRCFLDGLGLDRVHLMGTSMGGMIVQQFAVTHPERLLSLTVGCSHGGTSTALPPTDETLGLLIAGSQDDADDAVRLAGQEMMFHPTSLTGDRRTFDFYLATKQRYPHSAAEIGRRITAIAEYDVWEKLPTLAVATLVITGDGDRLVLAENSRRLAERIPGARLIVLENAGHIFWIERSEATNDALLAHFDANS